MSTEKLALARARIAACLMLDTEGRLVQRHDHLNLAGLGLDEKDMGARFDPQERGLPEIGLADLVHLRYLDLTGNALEKLPDGVTEMRGLVWLGLNFNRLVELPRSIGGLKNLKRLYLRGNRLEGLPEEIGGLGGLMELDLSGNQLASLPGSFVDLLAEERGDRLHIDFDRNPAEFLRLFKKDRSAFRAELEAQREASAVVREGKLLFVGEGEVGKSTLLRALQGKPFAAKLEQTQGVELSPLALPLGAKVPEVTLNGWDFSGQDPVRDTHQIFFTQPAIYLLVFRARLGTKVQTLIDWLWLIKHRTKQRAKVLIVATEAGGGRAQVEDLDRVWRAFGGSDGLLVEERIHYVECNGAHAGGQIGIAELREKLLSVVRETSGFSQKVSHQMLAVRKRVEVARRDRPCMAWRDFADLCHENGRGLAREHVPAFARQQHEIGSLVWLERGLLKETVILAPDWLGKALAYIFQPREDKGLPALRAVATQAQIDAEWRQPRRFGTEGREEPPLPEGMFPLFRAFMAELDLWHAIDAEERGSMRRYLIPKLFSASRRDWDARWSVPAEAPARFKRQVQINGWDGAPLNTWLLRAFFSRLMVRLYPQLLGRKDDAAEHHWLHGFRLQEDFYGEARVWFDKQRGRLFFDAFGPKPEALWHGLRSAIAGLRQEMASPGTEMEIELANYVPCSAAVACEFSDAEQEVFREEKVLSWLSVNPGKMATCNKDHCTQPCEISVAKLAEGIRATDGGAGRMVQLEEIGSKLDLVLAGVERVDERTCRMESGAEAFWRRMDDRFQSFARMLADSAAGIEMTAERLAEVSMLAGAVKGELRDFGRRLDDDHRVGPCLFFIEPVAPSFWKDTGDLFGKKFRLHLCCERTLLPVSWFTGTESLGRYDFTLDAAWWAATRPCLKVVSRLLGAFVPAAGLLGELGDVQGLLAVTKSEILKQGKTLYENTEKMLALEDGPAAPKAKGRRKAGAHGVGELTEARDLELKELHAFLLKQVGATTMEAANFGLVRRWDNGQGRHLWVHPSQKEKYLEPR